ncbi:unnamed protein product [Larinioides sclopetarius]|uniref:Uncharacterized protein n=1 Tax=Larinioides sclopetarius TaxID=280406 RepID=A0AAV2B5V3_9ARAC
METRMILLCLCKVSMATRLNTLYNKLYFTCLFILPILNKEAADSENKSKNVEQLECKAEPIECSDIQNEINNQLLNTCVQSKSISEQNGGVLIQDVYSFDELMKENEILKKENENLFDKFNKQEGIIATYVEKLPVLQGDFSAVSTEFNQLQKKAETNEAEISSLKSAIQALMSEITQHDNKVDEVRRQMKRQKISPVSSSSFDSERLPPVTSVAEISCLKPKEWNLEHPDIVKISHGNNSSEKELPKSSFTQATQHHAKSRPQVSSDSVVCDYQNSGEDLQIICENMTELSAEKCIKRESQISSPEVEHSISKPGKTNRVVHDIKKSKTQCDSLGRQAVQDASGEVALQDTYKELFDLNPENLDDVPPNSTTDQDYFHKELSKNNHEEPNQEYVKDDLQIIGDGEHRNSSHKKRDHILNVVETGSCQNVETSKNYRKDKIRVFSSNQKDKGLNVLSCSEKDPIKKIQASTKDSLKEKRHEGTFQKGTQKLTKSKVHEPLSKRNNVKFTNLNRTEGGVMSSKCKSISIENNSLQKESTKYLCKKVTQESVKDGLQVNLTQQKRDPIFSNFIHPKKPSLVMKRTISLPIPEDRKSHCRSKQNLGSTKQKRACSVPISARLNNSCSVKHSRIDEQLFSPPKTSSGAVTSEDKTSYPVQITNIASENDSALNSVNKNSCTKAKTKRYQPISTPVSVNEQTQKRERNEGFKRRRTESIPLNSIGSIFKDIDDRLISEAKQNYYVHLLTEFLTNPTNCPDISSLIFLVIDHLRLTEKNYLLAFAEDRANCIFLPSSEFCIVSTLLETEKKSKTYAELKLVNNFLNTIYHLIVTPRKGYASIHGFASLCRVFTEICKRKNDLLKPLTLCADILKKKLYIAAYLIASIVGIWREPFMLPNDQSEEAMILLGSISMGGTKKTKNKDDSNWFCSTKFLLEYFPFPSLPDIKVAINFLKDKIISNCTQKSHEKSWMVTSSLVILASLQPWDWIKTHLILEYIIPNLSRYAIDEPNEKAFALFCDLCVDVYNLSPCMKHWILKQYFHHTPNNGSNFVQEWAAVFLVKYLILTKQKIHCDLSDWLENNQDKYSVKKFKDFYLRKNIVYKGLRSCKDIVIL